MGTSPILEVAEDLKKLLLGHIQHAGGDETQYTTLRRQLLAIRQLTSLIPEFVKTDTTLHEVRRRAQKLQGGTNTNVASYETRRDWLAAEFRPLLEQLQRPQMSSVEEILAETLTTVDSAHIRAAWDKAIERRHGDPEGAITIARSLIEAVCKHVLGAGNYSNKDELPDLYKKAARVLRLTDDGFADESLKQVMRGCVQIVHGLGEFRNKLGDAHGKGPVEPLANILQAELAVTTAGAMATFLLSTWESKQPSCPLGVNNGENANKQGGL